MSFGGGGERRSGIVSSSGWGRDCEGGGGRCLTTPMIGYGEAGTSGPNGGATGGGDDHDDLSDGPGPVEVDAQKG